MCSPNFPGVCGCSPYNSFYFYGYCCKLFFEFFHNFSQLNKFKQNKDIKSLGGEYCDEDFLCSELYNLTCNYTSNTCICSDPTMEYAPNGYCC